MVDRRKIIFPDPALALVAPRRDFLLKFVVRYDILYTALPITVGGCPSAGGLLTLQSERREGCLMVTYEALFAYTMVIIGVVSLVIQITKKK